MEMYSNSDEHMAELKKLYDQIHKNDAPPADEDEEQAALVLDSIKAMLMLMVQNQVDSKVLELSLFYHWFRLITLGNRCRETDFDHWSSDLDCIMRPLIERLKQIASQIKDGPSEQMAALGSHVEALKNQFQSLKSDSKLDDPGPHAEAANKGIYGLIAVLMTKHGVNPVLIQNTLLYYWLRTTTFNHNVDESMFQKWERNWEDVVAHVDQFFKEWLLENSRSGKTDQKQRAASSKPDDENQTLLISIDRKRGFELETLLPKTNYIDRFFKLFPPPKSVSLLDVFDSIQQETDLLDAFEPFDFDGDDKRPDSIYFYAGLLKHTTRKSVGQIVKQADGIDPSKLEDTLGRYFSSENLKMANRRITGFIDEMEIASIPESGLHQYHFDVQDNLLTRPTALCCSEIEFPYALDLLLGNPTAPIEPDDIIIKDHKACRELLFGIADLLGFSYATRIRDFSEYNIYNNQGCDTGFLQPDAAIDFGVVQDNWDEMLRFAATIKTGYTSAAVLLPKFFNRFDDPIFKGVRELGRAVQTIYILKYIDSVELRRTIERHFDKAAFHAGLSKFVQKPRGASEFISYQDRELNDACATLLKNCILAWNCVHLSKIKQDTPDIEKTIKHGFVLVWKHIHLNGRIGEGT